VRKALLVLALVLLAGCTAEDGGPVAGTPAPTAEAGEGDVDSAQLRLSAALAAAWAAAGVEDPGEPVSTLEPCGEGRAVYRLRSSPSLPAGADPAAMVAAVRGAWEEQGFAVTETPARAEGVPPALEAEGDGLGLAFLAGAGDGAEVLEGGGETACLVDLLAPGGELEDAPLGIGELEDALTSTAEEVAPGAGFAVDEVRPPTLPCSDGEHAYLGLRLDGGPDDAAAAVAEVWRGRGYQVEDGPGDAVTATTGGARLLAVEDPEHGLVALRALSACFPLGP
jgi:hypothetical protein